MKFVPTRLAEVVLIEPQVFEDERGFFMEVWRRDRFARAGIEAEFVQENHSRSRRGALRGLHYQVRHVQGKLVRVTLGEVFDVAVDVRRSSSTFGRWVGVRLSAENRCSLWIPPGFAHGFLVLSESADFQYKCTDIYDPEAERTIRWDDPSIGITWPFEAGTEVVLSRKDATASSLDQTETFP